MLTMLIFKDVFLSTTLNTKHLCMHIMIHDAAIILSESFFHQRCLEDGAPPFEILREQEFRRLAGSQLSYFCLPLES